MTDQELGWVAGVLEGEGCFDYNRTPKYPRVRAEMTDEDVIDRLHRLVGGRKHAPKKRKGHWKQSYGLIVNGAEAVALMEAVLPLMGERRRAKIERLLTRHRDLL